VGFQRQVVDGFELAQALAGPHVLDMVIDVLLQAIDLKAGGDGDQAFANVEERERGGIAVGEVGGQVGGPGDDVAGVQHLAAAGRHLVDGDDVAIGEQLEGGVVELVRLAPRISGERAIAHNVIRVCCSSGVKRVRRAAP